MSESITSPGLGVIRREACFVLTVILNLLSLLVAVFILAVWSLISAYVFRLGLRGSGIGFDYLVFTMFVAIACAAGGVF